MVIRPLCSARCRRGRDLLLGQRVAPVLREPREPLSRHGNVQGFVALGVSRLDLPASVNEETAPGVVAEQDNWMAPVVASKQSSTTFSDKEQIWVDQDDDSPFFGNAYVLGLVP